MLLALDIGNSNIVVGVMQSGKVLHSFRISTHPLVTSDEFRLKIESLLNSVQIKVGQVRFMIISSVVPSLRFTIENAFKEIKHHWVSEKSPFHFKISVPDTASVGADRLVNAEAVAKYFGGGPAIVLDSGTATTICALDENQKYLGGAIFTGLELSMKSLAQSTAKLFNIELHLPAKAIGASTVDALQSGIVRGYLHQINGLIDDFKNELGVKNPKIVVTGGASVRFFDQIKGDVHYDADLTLKGLWSIYEQLST